MSASEKGLQRWREYATSLGFAGPVQAEKDYLQELLLLSMFSVSPVAGLVFRGGTALSKLYATGRFSEDLDFIFSKRMELEEAKRQVEKAINRINDQYHVTFSLEEYRSMLKYQLKITGPIYGISRNAQARQTVRVDINTYEMPIQEPSLVHRIPIYEDLRPYYLHCAQPKELVADKVKAIIERKTPVARDAYDLWIMITKYKMDIDLGMVEKKLSIYGEKSNMTFSKTAFNRKLGLMEKSWGYEISRLTSNNVSYAAARKAIMEALKAAR